MDRRRVYMGGIGDELLWSNESGCDMSMKSNTMKADLYFVAFPEMPLSSMPMSANDTYPGG